MSPAEQARLLGIYTAELDEIHDAAAFYVRYMSRHSTDAGPPQHHLLPKVEGVALWLQTVHETSTALERWDGDEEGTALLGAARTKLNQTVTSLAWGLRCLGELAAYPGEAPEATTPAAARQRVESTREALRTAASHLHTAISGLTAQAARLRPKPPMAPDNPERPVARASANHRAAPASASARLWRRVPESLHRGRR